jgi:hypothetical protein
MMQEMILSMVERCRTNLSRVAKRVKGVPDPKGLGATKLLASLAAIDEKLTRGLKLDLSNPEPWEEGTTP